MTVLSLATRCHVHAYVPRHDHLPSRTFLSFPSVTRSVLQFRRRQEQAESQKAAHANKRSGEFMEDNPDPGRAYPCRTEYDIVKEQAWRKAWCEDLENQVRHFNVQLSLKPPPRSVHRVREACSLLQHTHAPFLSVHTTALTVRTRTPTPLPFAPSPLRTRDALLFRVCPLTQIELKRRLEGGIRNAEVSRDRVRAAQLEAAVKADRRREMEMKRLDRERINK